MKPPRSPQVICPGDIGFQHPQVARDRQGRGRLGAARGRTPLGNPRGALERGQKEAFVRVAYERNSERPLAELDSRDAAAAMRAYADEIDAYRGPADPGRAGRTRMGRVDPRTCRAHGPAERASGRNEAHWRYLRYRQSGFLEGRKARTTTMKPTPGQVAVKASPEGGRLITSGAHYLHTSKKDPTAASAGSFLLVCR